MIPRGAAEARCPSTVRVLNTPDSAAHRLYSSNALVLPGSETADRDEVWTSLVFQSERITRLLYLQISFTCHFTTQRDNQVGRGGIQRNFPCGTFGAADWNPSTVALRKKRVTCQVQFPYPLMWGA